VIFGWDLGGAHVKLAVLDAAGNLARVAQVPCPLWLGLEHLERALRESAGAPGHARHALTMTGELVDLFPDRATGVAEILATFQRVVEGCEPLVFAGDRFLAASEAKATWSDVASANWLASAALTATRLPEALVLDIGSTTTDVTVIANGRVQARGGNDHDRLASEELVYSGVVRTPLAAVADRVPFGGDWVATIAELFATTGDLYRISGELDPRFDQSPTADGRPRSREASMRRLARMIGCDFETAAAPEWERLARWLAHAQLERIQRACARVLSRGLIGPDAPVVGLGVGSFLAARLAADMQRRYVDFAELAGVAADDRLRVNTCGPAFAVAALLRRRL